MIVAINQPCYLPWRGYFALMKSADVFVFYDDVQFTSTRRFFARVKLKTALGPRWLTVPVRKAGHFGQRIDEVEIADDGTWRTRHRDAVRAALRGARFADAVEPVLSVVTDTPWTHLSRLTVSTTFFLARMLDIGPRTVLTSELGIGGRGSERLLAICRSLRATTYLTGHGALEYLDHEAFEAAGIAVEYMDYDLSPYPQLHGPFEPYVTVLDLLANTGAEAPHHVRSRTRPWREMVAARKASR